MLIWRYRGANAARQSSRPDMRSLRLRLLLGTLLWIAASIMLTGWGLGRMFQQHVARQFHAELQTHLDQLTAQLDLDAQGRPLLRLPLSDPRFQRPYSGYYWQVDSPNERGLLRSRSLWDEALSVPADQLAAGEMQRHHFIGPQDQAVVVAERKISVDGRELRLTVAADAELMNAPVARFQGTLWLALALLGGGLALAALVQVYVGLAPLRRLQAALVRVRQGDSPQLAGRFPSEVMPLVEEFNSVLGQNAEVVARARTQAGNLAHALKTPLTVLGNAAGAAENRDSELAHLVNDQVGIARRQVDYHLARARAAATARLPGARTAVQPVIAGLLRTMRRLHAERGLELRLLDMPAALAFRGEEHDLQEMLGNLLDNACKWARSRVEVEVRAEETHGQGRLLLSVADDGPGVPAGQREIILQRGMRADERTPGSGLGLAIVVDLARLYGGELRLQEAASGGLQAVLELPAAQ
ncbi:Two-component sensor histidine kinase [Sterolibacterium denitrificans]|uniref:histidine kinase n=1 Tax=Sterolibacterium denitrificans TaxID=157592 RepID=A0A7Z7MUE4_9PROT|nr:sensor histidine kinase [Sterolibacterium denitrificans]SMB22656.1 Two-component sensor histidine kinase [Sterolibacterium denitrificans]